MLKIVNSFEKKENTTVNKLRVKIVSRCNSMLHLWKKNIKRVTKKLESIDILQIKLKSQRIVYLIQCLISLRKFLCFSKMSQTIIIILL